MDNPSIVYQRRVPFHESDAMAVSHHSNYYKYFEEARLEWLRQRELLNCHSPYTSGFLAVLDSSCEHSAPAFIHDLLLVKLQVRQERLKIRFRYVITNQDKKTIARGKTLHVFVDAAMKVQRIPKPVIEALRSEPWTET